MAASEVYELVSGRRGPTLKFRREEDLVAAFLATVPDDWTAYAETGGFDVLLVHRATGVQIGIEAKLKLNAQVLVQAVEDTTHRRVDRPGPDFRAVLVPESGPLSPLCRNLGLTEITMGFTDRNVWQSDANFASGKHGLHSRPEFPTFDGIEYGRYTPFEKWFDCAPAARVWLPDYVPDVSAGTPAPVQLTDWKIRAIQMCLLAARMGHVTRHDFAALGLSMSRWTQGGWLAKGQTRGTWVPGPNFPMDTFRKQHPAVVDQIAADAPVWLEKAGLSAQRRAEQGALL